MNSEKKEKAKVAEKCGPLQCLQTFEEIIDELKRRENNNNLKYNDENVDLILLAIEKSPPSSYYPHPMISDVFKGKLSSIYAGEDNVASWAGKGNKGLKARVDVPPEDILGVYGGIITKKTRNVCTGCYPNGSAQDDGGR